MLSFVAQGGNYSLVYSHIWRTSVCFALWEACSFFFSFGRNWISNRHQIIRLSTIIFLRIIHFSVGCFLILFSFSFKKKKLSSSFSPTECQPGKELVPEKIVSHTVFLPEKNLKSVSFCSLSSLTWAVESSSVCSVQNQTNKGVVDERCLNGWECAHCVRRDFLQQVLQDCTS